MSVSVVAIGMAPGLPKVLQSRTECQGDRIHAHVAQRLTVFSRQRSLDTGHEVSGGMGFEHQRELRPLGHKLRLRLDVVP